MKDSILLLMTPNMSLEKWNKRGQLSRELTLYKELCKKTNLKLIIFSYGRNDYNLIEGVSNFTVLCMPDWIPSKIPFRLQNFIYHLTAILLYRKHFRRAVLSKTNQFSSGLFGLLLKFTYRIPLVVRMGFYYSHFKGMSAARKFQEKLTFVYCDLILTTSPEATSFIADTYCVDKKKILSICNSIDLTKFKPIDLDKEYDLIFVGKLEHQKNIKLLTDLVNVTRLKTLVIGHGSLQPLIEDCLKKSPHLTWMDRVDNADLAYYYNKSRCFILLSLYEGNPKVLLEAMACGLPCITTKVPGIRECIEDGVTGIFAEGNIDDIKLNICKLINDNAKMKTLGNNAHHWVAQHSDFFKNIDKEVNFYHKFLNN